MDREPTERIEETGGVDWERLLRDTSPVAAAHDRTIRGGA